MAAEIERQVMPLRHRHNAIARCACHRIAAPVRRPDPRWGIQDRSLFHRYKGRGQRLDIINPGDEGRRVTVYLDRDRIQRIRRRHEVVPRLEREAGVGEDEIHMVVRPAPDAQAVEVRKAEVVRRLRRGAVQLEELLAPHVPRRHRDPPRALGRPRGVWVGERRDAAPRLREAVGVQELDRRLPRQGDPDLHARGRGQREVGVAVHDVHAVDRGGGGRLLGEAHPGVVVNGADGVNAGGPVQLEVRERGDAILVRSIADEALDPRSVARSGVPVRLDGTLLLLHLLSRTRQRPCGREVQQLLRQPHPRQGLAVLIEQRGFGNALLRQRLPRGELARVHIGAQRSADLDDRPNAWRRGEGLQEGQYKEYVHEEEGPDVEQPYTHVVLHGIHDREPATFVRDICDAGGVRRVAVEMARGIARGDFH
mmetsp:Transcript_56202/g.171178  ORF Transcript_56202/g.171178 Transcript_56202/m.171178 type:complete len:424 (+) Transcript_56202:5841-7112(+)